MIINLKSFIENESAVKSGGFSGAVFLTYTLNLGFFEQIIAPALERAGCSNVLIISDPDGYAEAMDMGLKNVCFAGLRYVCTPLFRKSHGIQHIKMLLMAGANQGRLLIGSGNLTLNGYSRNLEIFSCFEYDHNNPDFEAKKAFHSVWELLENLSRYGTISPSAQRQLDVISASASWLLDQPATSDSFYVWNNFHSSLWSQFMDWREKSGLLNSPVKALKIFSPYYDQDTGMLRKFTETLLPNRVDIYISLENTTLNRQALLSNWPKGFPNFQLSDIRESRENQSYRILHGKLIIGIEDSGSWCIAGSANMTRSAFENSWQLGSNLEMVTFQWSPEPNAFDYLLKEPIVLTPIKIDSPNTSNITNYSENPRRVTEETVLITELTFDNKILTGKLSHWPALDNQDVELVLLRSGLKYSITFNKDLSFQIPLSEEIRTSESAFVRGGGVESVPRWIDIPAILQEYGSRSYHERIQAKLDTVAGAESLFHELMEFLLDRASPDQPLQNHRRTTQRTNYDHPDDEETYDLSSIPDIERFVVPERDPSGLFQVGKYTRLPYNQNIRSLRDLLSIVLLRLTSTPAISPETKLDEDLDEQQIKDIQPEEVETTESQATACQRLCHYIIDYCGRYSKRLCDNDFIVKITPDVLLDNHLTLSRVLLEFNSHVSEFKAEDFTRCYLLIWAPLFFPSIVGIEKKSTWQLFADKGLENNFIDAWKRLNILSHLIVMTSIAMGQPPTWQSGLYTPNEVSRFLALKKVLLKVKSYQLFNMEDITNPVNIGNININWDDSVRIFCRILDYLPPAEERLSPILEWTKYPNDQTKQMAIIDRINKANLTDEFERYKRHPKPIKCVSTEPDDEGFVCCPNCGGSLSNKTIMEIHLGKLVLCSSNSDVWLYRTDKPTKRLI